MTFTLSLSLRCYLRFHFDLCYDFPALREGLGCSVAPAGPLHPVQALLERFEAGVGCSAREIGNKETHVVAVGRETNSPDNKVPTSPE